MSVSAVHRSNVVLRVTFNTVAFLCSSFAAIFSLSAGYGLLKMLLVGMSSGAAIGLAEFSAHSGLTIVLFVLAALCAYVAKKCVW
jgi:hypothetical protein